MTETDATTGSIAVGAIVRAAREKTGMTQSVLGSKLGVTATAVSYWETGKRDIGIADLLRIADALGVTASSLLPVPHRGETEPVPLPEGEYATVHIMGHDYETGWVTDGIRAGVPVLVIRDWDGRVLREVPGQSLYQFVPLATPLKRPEPQKALAGGFGGVLAQRAGADPWTDADADDENDPF